jgi:hypothetical protein
MKTFKIITLIVLVLTIKIGHSQETIVPLDGDVVALTPMTGDVYLKDVNDVFTKYLETWLYDDGVKYFKITFTKKEHINGPTRFYKDYLTCEYLYKENGIVIYDTYGTDTNNTSLEGNYIVGASITNLRNINLIYSEPPTNGSCHRYASGKLHLKYEDNQFITTPQLIWTRTNNELYGDVSTCPDGTEMDLTEFVIPANMILVKQ